jgi:broad-specificity NMP kinase
MRKIIAVCGVPGTGKTTLFREFMKNYTWERREEAKLVSSEYCKDLNLHILGKYDEGEVFAGTDKLSLAVQPEFIKWLESSDTNVLWEGDRLTSAKLFEFCANMKGVDFEIIVLKCPDETLKERYGERGSEQSETFLAGRYTKISNIESNFDLMSNVTVYKNSSKEEQAVLLSKLNSSFVNL